MKKKIIFTISFVIILFSGFYIYESKFVSPIVTVEKVTLADTTIDENNFPAMYGISENDFKALEQNSSRLKHVSIVCSCDNKSIFKSIEGAEFIFENDKELPNIIVGTNPDVGFEQLNIKSHKTIVRGITVLIDPKEYSDEEIMKMLKNVKITMVSKRNGKTIIESKPVSLVVGASS